MGRKIDILLMALILFVVVVGKVEAAAPPVQPPIQPIVHEVVSITLSCQTANLTITSGVISNDTSLVHFPSGIDMGSDAWINVTSVNVLFSKGFCSLVFGFENVDNKTAKSIADTLKVEFEKAFNITYAYNYTNVDDYVTITYMGAGVQNLTQRTQELMEKCLAYDLGGFSLTFVPMTSEPTAITILSATKSAGSFDWEYSMTVMYFTSIPPGTGTHTIDVLQLLHVESLEPSPYSDLNVTCGTVVIYGDVAFVDCEPDQVYEEGQRGWYISPSIGGVLMAMFSFGNDTAPFTELWLKFSGTIIPEFTAPIWTVALISVSFIAVAFKKRLNCVKG